MTRSSSTSPQRAIAPVRKGRLADCLRELMNAALAITAARSIPEMLQSAVDQARRVIGAEQALIAIRPATAQSLHAFSTATDRRDFDLERDGGALNALAQCADKPLRLNKRALKAKPTLVVAEPASAGLRGWLAVPLTVGDSRLGEIQLANKEHGQFSKEDEFLLSQLARFACVAVEKARGRSEGWHDINLSGWSMRNAAGEAACQVEIKRDVPGRRQVEEEIRARVRQQAAVVELGRQALAGMEVTALMQSAAELVARTLENELCKVLELQADGRTLLLSAGVGWKPGYVGHKLLSAGVESHAGFTLASSGPVIIDDLRTETRFAEPLLQEHGVISGMSVLIEGRERPFGVIGTHSRAHKTFTNDDLIFLSAVANVLAAAIERKRVEQELRQSEERFRMAQRSANIGAYEWNLTTGIIQWSEELPILKGLAPDGKFASWLERIHPDDRQRTTRAIEEAIAKRGDFDLETRLITPQGEVWLVSRGGVFCEDAEPSHVLGVVLDVTARKQAEDLLRRSEKLAAAGRLAAMIAHEINNPLESITNLLYLLEHHRGLDEAAQKYVRMAQDELHRVAHIARQTLSFHRESLTPVPVNLSELLENVLRIYGRHIQGSGVQVETRLEVDYPVKVFPAEIQQVASNLIVNALEALGSRGRLQVRLVPAVEWNGERRHGVRLTVVDTGPGIAPEIRRHIFEPFFTTKGEKGTGLGLWVINGIVQKHQGHIRLRSSTVQGRSYTCFSIFLPLATQREIVHHRKAPLVNRQRLAA